MAAVVKLLVDLGNSYLKWGIDDGQHTLFQYSIDYRRPDFNQLILQSWSKQPRPRIMAVSSVADHQLTIQMVTLARQLWPQISVLLPTSSATIGGITSAYKHPESLGVDRWLALLAAHKLYSGHCCIVDCGTALTIDFLDADGNHLGGYITPGLTLMKQALQLGTTQLPLSDQVYQDSPANDTAAAIANGILLAAVGLIEQAHKQSPIAPCQLILTGGDAMIIAPYLSLQAFIQADLILRGLSFYCDEVSA